MKKLIRSFSPLLLYPVLYYPYKIMNEKVIVKWLGCGCPQYDPATGNEVIKTFNANSFTLLFWGILALLTAVLSAILSRKCKHKWEKVVYPFLVFVIAIILSWKIRARLQWD